jgi:predicted XRE-type DNA-binding protein
MSALNRCRPRQVDATVSARAAQRSRVRHDDPIPDLKRALGAELARIVADWNGDDIAYMLGTDRFRIAELRRGKLDRFSLETLIRFATRAGKRVSIQVVTTARPYSKRR